MDRFFPVLYPKVRCGLVCVISSPRNTIQGNEKREFHIKKNHKYGIINIYLCTECGFSHCIYLYSQASRLIVTFDEHVINNNFKFGVVYQKFGQVSFNTNRKYMLFLDGSAEARESFIIIVLSPGAISTDGTL